MARLTSALFLVVSGLTLGACGPKQDPASSLCDGTASQPATCTQTCDPTPGAANTCPSGFHCSPDGTCDQACTPGGNQCASDQTCTADGTCIDNAGSGSATGPDANCPAVHFTATAITPSIALLIDQSGSMADPFSGNSGESKYQAVHDALVGASGVVTTLQTKAYFGATLFTSGNTCPALKETPRALSNLANIKQLIEANSPDANTPTPQSIDAVVADFAANPAPAGSPPIIVLATDGLPNTCNGDTNTEPQSVASATAAYAAGIKLFFLSVGDAVADTHAQAMANAGVGATAPNNAPYFTGSDPATLAAAFQTIIGGVLSCDLSISGMIDATQAMNGTVTLNGTTLTYGTDWTLSAPSTITLTGTACTTLKDTTNPVVNATFPCGSVIQ